MNKLNENIVLDEMQERSIGKSGVICTVVTFFYLLIEITYKYISTNDILNCSWEIILLILVAFIFYLGNINQKEMNLPKGLLGKQLPIDETKKAKKQRAISYILDSLVFSISMSILTYLFAKMELDSTQYIAIEFILLFIVSLIIDYIVGEYKCRKYREWEKSLDQE